MSPSRPSSRRVSSLGVGATRSGPAVLSVARTSASATSYRSSMTGDATLQSSVGWPWASAWWRLRCQTFHSSEESRTRFLSRSRASAVEATGSSSKSSPPMTRSPSCWR
ncbi:hypothetical protein [Nocardiopsis codii]|uniref:hypothetical protein n=1 Tax=Nocardiopsis codii TaxID=3065942 RepID=UPI0038B37CF5